MEVIRRWGLVLAVSGALLLAGCSGGPTAQGTTNFDDLAVDNLTVMGMLAAVGGPAIISGQEISLGDVGLSGHGTQISLRDAEQVIDLGNPDTGAVLRVDAGGGTLAATELAFSARLALVGKTAAYTLTKADTAGLAHTNGATGPVTFTLPAAETGLNYCFYVAAGQPLYVDPASGDQIAVLTNAAGDRISAGTAGHAVCLAALDGATWAAYSVTGTWTDAD